MEQNSGQQPSYWPSVMVGALIIGIVLAVIGLVGQYITIGSEPTGASFGLGQALGTFACLFGVFGGFIATRHYAKENEITFPVGKGATIGFFTGVVGTIFSTVITLIWTYVIDTNLNQAYYDWQMRNLEMQNIPRESMEMAMSMIPEPGALTPLLINLGVGIIVIGLLNLISGIIGAKVFAKEED